jgi:hypothetical protein
MSELSTPQGKVLAAYIDGAKAYENPFPRGTAEYEGWLLEFALILEGTIRNLEERVSLLRKENKSLMEQMG